MLILSKSKSWRLSRLVYSTISGPVGSRPESSAVLCTITWSLWIMFHSKLHVADTFVMNSCSLPVILHLQSDDCIMQTQLMQSSAYGIVTTCCKIDCELTFKLNNATRIYVCCCAACKCAPNLVVATTCISHLAQPLQFLWWNHHNCWLDTVHVIEWLFVTAYVFNLSAQSTDSTHVMIPIGL